MIGVFDTGEQGQSRQRGWSRALRVRASRIAMRAAMMMVLLTRRYLGSTQDVAEMSIHQPEHESRRNERAQEQQPEDERRHPVWHFNAPHPLHLALPDLSALSKSWP